MYLKALRIRVVLESLCGLGAEVRGQWIYIYIYIQIHIRVSRLCTYHFLESAPPPPLLGCELLGVSR